MLVAVDVDFVKYDRRYVIRVRRETGPALAPVRGPGFDEWMPHDVAHMLVEIEAGLTGGVFGRVASGAGNLFHPADPRQQRRTARRRRRPTPHQRAQMSTSERLASVCVPAWERARGRRSHLPDWLTQDAINSIEPRLRERIFDRLDSFGQRWQQLPAGRAITVHWPTGDYSVSA